MNARIEQPDGDVFVCARFAGGRFDSHVIPFDVLPDLGAYRGLIVEVAKLLFKRRHDNRVRVPKGFEDSFQLGLARIEGGHSAVAIGRHIPTPVNQPLQQEALGFAEYPEFEEARRYVDELIRRVGQNQNVPDDFPPELAGRFNPFGQSLRADEYIELGYGTANPVRYDTFIRRQIVLSRERLYENPVDAAFTLNGGIANTGVIHVLDENGSALDFRPLTEFEFNKAYERRATRVHLVGTGLFDGQERLRRLLDVSVVYDDGEPRQPFEERLNEIATTAAGWYAPDNPAPAQPAVDAMRRFVSMAVLDVGAQAPYLYPMPDGGVAAEWTIGDWEASANIEPDARHVSLHAVNVSSLVEDELAIAVNAADMRERFRAFWERIAGGDEHADR